MRKVLIAIFVIALGLTTTVAGSSPASAAGTPIPLHIFTFNDFHGRINSTITMPFAYTLENAALADPDNSMVLSVGDSIGASEFASFIDQDKPAIQLLNDFAATPGLHFAASAMGNHELDQGLDDLTNRVIPAAQDWTYLSANMVSKTTGDPVLTPYVIYNLPNGLKVGVVGAVTQDVPSLVSPAGIKTVEFTDPVAAVNKYADILKNDEKVDVVVAVYHNGADTDKTLADAVANSATFAHLINDTNTNVDAIVNGHTHMKYAWIDPHGRPVVQAASYGAAIGQIDFTIDSDTKAVLSASTNVLTVDTAAPVDLTLGSMQTIKDHVDAALAKANQLGQVTIGKISSSITTAFTAGEWAPGMLGGVSTTTYQDTGTAKRDDRNNESSLSNLVADAFLDTANNSPQVGGADIGIINAGGGLRAELVYGTDGTISYAAANAVLPFYNNVWTIELTGAQVKQFLEQQWQTAANGGPADRGFRVTGVSSNVTYTVDTDDPNAAPCVMEADCSWNGANSHVTSVFVNGQPLDANKTYKIITISFLLNGSDNYRVMLQGKNAKDTGLLDRDVWIGYLQKLSRMTGGVAATSVAPSFARPSVVVNNLTPATEPMKATAVTAGDNVTASLSRLNLTSLGSPANATLTTYLLPLSAAGQNPATGTKLATTTITQPGDTAGCAAAGVPTTNNPVSTGCAKLSVTIPAATAAGDYVLVSVAGPSGTTVRIALTVKAAASVGTGGQVVPPSPAGTAAAAVLVLLGGAAVLTGVRRRARR